ncbi:MAG TPA: DUF302 domain-containing protein [Patescibacteria group bacterium]
MELGYKRKFRQSFAEVEKKMREALTNEGFGIITEIDAKATFKKKLDVDFEDYLILGACHPQSAHALLSTDKELGLLLPCNVIIYQSNEETVVSAIMPRQMLAMVDHEELAAVAVEIEEKLKRAIDNL